MILVDTHTHLYLKHFDKDRQKVIQNAIDKGVHYMLIPNIDSHTIEAMISICNHFPNNCFPMIGLHPTDVKLNYESELERIKDWLKKRKFIAIGEIGIDLYWDNTFILEQEYCFKQQVNLAKKYKLPLVIHSRNSMKEILAILKKIGSTELRGVFHCFSGNLYEAYETIEMGYYIGIGGGITFKNSKLIDIVKKIELENILLETDAPFLSPEPFRSTRNESAYIYHIAEKVAEIKNINIKKVAEITTQNAKELFKLQ